jgi:hypothetical protein
VIDDSHCVWTNSLVLPSSIVGLLFDHQDRLIIGLVKKKVGFLPGRLEKQNTNQCLLGHTWSQ